MALCLVVIRQSSMAGLPAKTRSFVSLHSIAENGTLLLVRSPTMASLYLWTLNTFLRELVDAEDVTNELIETWVPGTVKDASD